MELKTRDGAVFVLEEYQNALRRQATVGVVLIPLLVLSLSGAGLALLCQKEK